MSQHPVDKMLKEYAYFKGAALCYVSLNVLNVMIFCLEIEIINFVIALGFVAIFFISGEVFISELKRSNFFARKFFYFLFLDSFLTMLSGIVLPVFMLLKVPTAIWLSILVSECWKE